MSLTIQKSYNMGKTAHEYGAICAPVSDRNFMKELLKVQTHRDRYMKAWLRGWHQANLEANNPPEIKVKKYWSSVHKMFMTVPED